MKKDLFVVKCTRVWSVFDRNISTSVLCYFFNSNIIFTSNAVLMEMDLKKPLKFALQIQLI